ncbi:hypothetical protein IW261DRAFT_1492322 [Armillaria novae-zelandiae]|uniref:Uncharacterized protein n=1 Tax=Armillaria novae-zelandiae TaxID=153914 RepID=A0AA39P2K1_9AGAR|nr:hypothetical protein IW261DRAFT_1492322 [Armillaria novae-zelandiae]
MTNTKFSVLYNTIRLTCQTLVYGMYIIIMSVCSYVMLKRGLRSRSRISLFCMLVFMFSVSTAYWILSLYQVVLIITTSFVHNTPLEEIAFTPGRNEQDVMNALVLLNYVLTDGVVVWRAWVLCRDEYSKSLILPLVFLCLALLCVLVTIVLRITITAITINGHIVAVHSSSSRALDYLQVSNVVLSLLTNIFSTSIVAIKARRHRHWVTSALRMKGRNMTVAERIFILLAESGLIYCLSVIILLIATTIRLPFGTLGDIYAPISVQFAGIYPTIVILLVSRQGELNETTAFTVADKGNPLERPANSVSNLAPIEFGGNPNVNESFGGTETVRRSESTVS